MIFLMPFLAQAIDLPPIAPVRVVQASPESVTQSIVTASCDIAARGASWSKVMFTRQGGRGYNYVDANSKGVRRTPVVWTISANSDPAFSGYSMSEINQSEIWFKKSADDYLVLKGRYGMIQDLSTITVSDKSLAEKYVGFCTLTNTAQSPLTEAEVQKISKR